MPSCMLAHGLIGLLQQMSWSYAGGGPSGGGPAGGDGPFAVMGTTRGSDAICTTQTSATWSTVSQSTASLNIFFEG